MTPQQLLYNAAGRPHIEGSALTGPCCLCGGSDGSLERKPFIKDAFTNLDYLKEPSSSAICAPCAYVFTDPKLRTSSWMVTADVMVWLKREDIWEVLLTHIPATPFAIYVTTSWKKHGAVKTRVNYDTQQFFVQFEETGVIFDRKVWEPLADSMKLLYSIPAQEQDKKQPRSFFTKEQIRTGAYDQRRIRAFGLAELLDLEATFKTLRTHPAFRLLLYALNQHKLGREALT